MLSFFFEDPHAHGVKSANPRAFDAILHQSFSHGDGGFIGERECENGEGFHAFLDQVIDLLNDHPSLSRTSSSYDEEWPFGMVDGLVLLLIEGKGLLIGRSCDG